MNISNQNRYLFIKEIIDAKEARALQLINHLKAQSVFFFYLSCFTIIILTVIGFQIYYYSIFTFVAIGGFSLIGTFVTIEIARKCRHKFLKLYNALEKMKNEVNFDNIDLGTDEELKKLLNS